MMLSMNKRGQGLSVSTIVIAAIALVVLVVLVAIFTGRIGLFSKGLDTSAGNKCTDLQGARCVNNKCSDQQIQIFGSKCDSNTEVCCKLAESSK